MKFFKLKDHNFLLGLILLISCSNEMPVQPVKTVDELSYNHWLLERLYIHAEKEIFPLSFYQDIDHLYNYLSDPYTYYIPPEQADDQRHHDTSTVVPGALGVEMINNPTADSARIEIFRIYPHSPAGKSELKRWDRIIAVNDTELTHDSAFSVFQKIRDKNKILNLKVLRYLDDGVDTLLIEIEKGHVYVPTVFIDTLDGVEVVEVTEFKRHTQPDGSGTSEELLHILRNNSHGKTRIIDIRNNPGGEISVCVNAAHEFIEANEPLLHIISHSFNPRGEATIDTITYINEESGVAAKSSFHILANEYSASCAEIFLGAIQDLRPDITVIGKTTYGKGIGQSRWSTPDSGLASITSISIRTPLWRDYHTKGLSVDIETDDSPLWHSLDLINNKTATKKVSPKRREQQIYRPLIKKGPPQAWIFGE